MWKGLLGKEDYETWGAQLDVHNGLLINWWCATLDQEYSNALMDKKYGIYSKQIIYIAIA
jgi:hypothetical protein